MAISRNIVENRKVPGTSIGPAGRGSITFGMDRPQTLESLRRNTLPPRQDMPMPTPMPNPRFPMPMPVPRPMPGPRGPMTPATPMPDYMQPFPFGIGPNKPRDREFEYFRTPREVMPGDNPFPGLEGFMGQGRTMMPLADPRYVQPPDMSEIDRLQNPNADRQNFMQMASAKVDPSDYRTIIKMIEQGLDPNDYMNRGGIASLLR